MKLDTLEVTHTPKPMLSLYLLLVKQMVQVAEEIWQAMLIVHRLDMVNLKVCTIAALHANVELPCKFAHGFFVRCFIDAVWRNHGKRTGTRTFVRNSFKMVPTQAYTMCISRQKWYTRFLLHVNIIVGAKKPVGVVTMHRSGIMHMINTPKCTNIHCAHMK